MVKDKMLHVTCKSVEQNEKFTGKAQNDVAYDVVLESKGVEIRLTDWPDYPIVGSTVDISLDYWNGLKCVK